MVDDDVRSGNRIVFFLLNGCRRGCIQSVVLGVHRVRRRHLRRQQVLFQNGDVLGKQVGVAQRQAEEDPKLWRELAVCVSRSAFFVVNQLLVVHRQRLFDSFRTGALKGFDYASANFRRVCILVAKSKTQPIANLDRFVR